MHGLGRGNLGGIPAKYALWAAKFQCICRHNIDFWPVPQWNVATGREQQFIIYGMHLIPGRRTMLTHFWKDSVTFSADVTECHTMGHFSSCISPIMHRPGCVPNHMHYEEVNCTWIHLNLHTGYWLNTGPDLLQPSDEPQIPYSMLAISHRTIHSVNVSHCKTTLVLRWV